GYNETVRAFSINHTDVVLKAWYRVPTSPEDVEVEVVMSPLSWLFQLLSPQEAVEAYVEGCLRDYYGSGVPSRRVTVNVTNVETGFAQSITTTTDASGYFRAGPFTLARGKEYRISIAYGGDDVYTSTSKTITYTAPPPEGEGLPVSLPISWAVIVVAIIVIIAVVLILIKIRKIKHELELLYSEDEFVG
ncbi:MAG: hypothetical protein DRJ67_05005, partial [Thermoprotei archaeon]